MGRIEAKVDDLVEEDASMTAALEVVLAESEADGEVEWRDVRDDITSGQWGRLIETGILVDGDEGFRVADEDEVREALSDTDSSVSATAATGDDEDDEGGFSTIDKLALAAAVGMILGYNITWVRNLIGGVVDLVLGPIADVVPFYAVILLAAVVTGVVSVLVQGQMMNTDAMQAQQERVQELQERRKEAKERGDDEALDEIQQEQMELMSEQFGNMASNFKPMIWTMLFSIPIFLWMYWMIGTQTVQPESIVMPLIGEREWTQGAAGPFPTWILWYFLCSLSLSNLIRKALNIQTTPTS